MTCLQKQFGSDTKFFNSIGIVSAIGIDEYFINLYNFELVKQLQQNEVIPSEEFELTANSSTLTLNSQQAQFEDTRLAHSELTR